MAVKERKGAKILITVNVAGSTGPIRFLAYEDESVAAVIGTVLGIYPRQGRFPVLESDINHFHLYCYRAYDGHKELGPLEPIGSSGSRKFEMHRRSEDTKTTRTQENSTVRIKGIGRKWKAWIDKSFGFVIPSH